MQYHIDVSDERNKYLLNNLIKNKFNAKTLDDFQQITKNDSVVFSPAKKINIEFINQLPNNITLFCGNINNDLSNILISKNINYINLLKNEIFTVKNANLTCEGVLAIIISNTPRSIFSNNILILGGGRIAKYLMILLNKIGIQFSMVTFNPIKFPSYFSFTTNCYFGYNFENDLNNFDVIVNTIPSKIIDDNLIKKIKKDTLFIETASENCLNPESAIHFNYMPASALPAKYTPETSGEYLYKLIVGEYNYE